ncbi:MAG: hypothetical protein IT428_32495 [Planctomycetaceae bacterium]|nr:hypothetical protein [Planctomycetaceae bacterium]
MQPGLRRLAAVPQISGEEVRTLLSDLFETLDVEIDVPEFGSDWVAELRQFITNVKAVLKPGGSKSDSGSVPPSTSKPLTESSVAALLGGGRRQKPGTRKRTLNATQQREAKRQADLRFEKRLRAHGITPGWTPAQRLANQKK